MWVASMHVFKVIHYYFATLVDFFELGYTSCITIWVAHAYILERIAGVLIE
jgi:hypothetical protein